MPTDDYEYRGLVAQAWDALRGDTSQWPDRAFYLEIIHRFGQPVLDIGCGTGRVLLDYLSEGLDIDGLDNSPEMLALCRQKALMRGLAPSLYEQYVELVALPRRYRTILIPSSSLQLITDAGVAANALQRLYAHLLPGGALAASVMTLWNDGDPLESESEQSAVRAEDGASFHRVARARYDPEGECEHTEDLYQMIIAGQVVAQERHRRSPATRSYTQTQARVLFQRAGWSVMQVYSGFTWEPAKPHDLLFTVVAQRDRSGSEGYATVG